MNQLYTLEEEYQNLIETIQSDLSKSSSQRGETRKKTLRKIQKDLEACKDVLNNLEEEIGRSSDYHTKETYKRKIKNFRQDLTDWSQQFTTAKNQKDTSTDKDALLLGHMDEEEEQNYFAKEKQDLRGKAVYYSQRLEKTDQSLKRSEKVAYQVEESASDTAFKLSQQGDQIRGQVNKVQNINQDIKIGARTITGLNRKTITIHLVMLTIICVLNLAIVILLVVILWKPITNLIEYIKNKSKQ